MTWLVEVFDNLRVGMILFGVVGFVENEQIDLVHGNEGMSKALIEDLRCADNDFVLGQPLLPSLALV